ncbi:MAG TPA: exosortase/archaeosortase family protein, partial [Candidatus Binatia bacterium]|nr:exosortase/archaeosortase family protein [Candidatus Binatia bacterium]
WKRLLLVASGIPLAVLGNLVRMLLIVIAAEIGGQHWGSYVHKSSWISLIPYALAFAGLFGLGWLLEKPKRPTTSTVP